MATKKFNNKEIFVVSYLDTSKSKEVVSQVGPFHDKEEAMSACKVFLKKGTCSWLVKYNG
jgi:hypothetical protein